MHAYNGKFKKVPYVYRKCGMQASTAAIKSAKTKAKRMLETCIVEPNIETAFQACSSMSPHYFEIKRGKGSVLGSGEIWNAE